jgi:drug/metabolite transporter (DMT)-like permease
MERERMTYGLLSALSWGISTVLAAVAARRIGALRTVVLGEVAGLAGYLTLFVFGPFSLRGVGSTAWLLVLAGVIAVAGYLALYRGLESGHVGLVSAISACYGGVIAVLSVVLLGERLTPAAIAGVAATVLGVMLAVMRRSARPGPGAAAVPPAPAVPIAPAAVPPAPAVPIAPAAVPPAPAGTVPIAPAAVPPAPAVPIAPAAVPPAPAGTVPIAPAAVPPAPAGTVPIAPAAAGPVGGTEAAMAAAPAIGVAFGLVAALCYGVGGFMIGRYTRNLGWLVPVVIARGGAMVLLLGLLATPLRRPAGGRITPGLAWALAAGLADAAGLIFFARGDQVGLVAVTAAVSSAYPVISLVGGLLIFRERLMRQQIGGTILILAGLILLGFSQ